MNTARPCWSILQHQPGPRTTVIALEPPAERGAVVVGAASLVPEGGRLAVQAASRTAVIVRRDGQLAALDAACPHYGVSLADGAADDTTLFCPACGVGFELASGCSASPTPDPAPPGSA